MSAARGLVWHTDDLDATQRRSHRLALRLVLPLSILFATLVAVFFLFFDFSKVSGPSMYPTLRDADYLLITKGWPDPRRGDVVVFRLLDPSTGTYDELVKRVVARGGDRVQIRGDRVFVNGGPEEFAHLVVVTQRTRPDFELTVPAGMVYVLGDNRPLSDDSRDFGPVSNADMHGRVVAIWAPISNLQLIPSP